MSLSEHVHIKDHCENKVSSARCLTWERVIVGALCCVINGHTTTTSHWSCICVRCLCIHSILHVTTSHRWVCSIWLVYTTKMWRSRLHVDEWKDMQLDVYAIISQDNLFGFTAATNCDLIRACFTTTVLHRFLLFQSQTEPSSLFIQSRKGHSHTRISHQSNRTLFRNATWCAFMSSMMYLFIIQSALR